MYNVRKEINKEILAVWCSRDGKNVTSNGTEINLPWFYMVIPGIARYSHVQNTLTCKMSLGTAT